jgi:hypothetical protein
MPKPPKPPHPQPKARRKKPGPDSPYELMHETRKLAREILKALKAHAHGGLTPQQQRDLDDSVAGIASVITRLNAADQPKE